MPRVGLKYSSYAGKCRSDSSPCNQSEERKVKAVASVSAQNPEDFITFGKWVKNEPVNVLEEALKESEVIESSGGDSAFDSVAQDKGGEQGILLRKGIDDGN
jgi:hypothetical protein